MRRLLAATAIAAAFAAPVTPAHADHYWRDCGGNVDTECRGRVCPTDCWTRDCLVWVDVFHDSQTALCVSPVNGS